MVGNDLLDDSSSSTLGIETYLITNHMLNKHNKEINANHVSTYHDFYEFVKGLDKIK